MVTKTIARARRSAWGVLISAAVGLPTQAVNAQHSDILLVDLGGQVAVGAANNIDAPDESFDLSVRVFEAIMAVGSTPPTPADYETDIGFFGPHAVSDSAALGALGAAALPATAQVTANAPSFTANGASDVLFYWDGNGAIDFQPIASVQLGVSFAFNPPAFASTGPHGDLDDHPIFQLQHAGAGVPADGVYLISPTVSVAGLTTSDNFFVVMLVDALLEDEDDVELVEAALEAYESGAPNAVVDFGGGVTKDFAFYEQAVEWVENSFVVPEPAAIVLGLCGALAVAVTSRRRRAV